MTKWCKIRSIFTPFCEYGLAPIRSLRTGTHHWGNNAWTGADDFPETNQGEPRFSTLLAGTIRSTSVVRY